MFQRVTISDLAPVRTNFELVAYVARAEHSHELLPKGKDSPVQMSSLWLRDDTGKMKVTAWADLAPRLDAFEEGHVVSISNASVKPAKRQGAVGALYTLTLTEHSTVARHTGRFDYRANRVAHVDCVPLEQLDARKGHVVSVVATVQTRGPLVVPNAAGKNERVNVVFADATGNVSMTLWGSDARHFGPKLVPGARLVVLLEDVLVDMYQSRLQLKFTAGSDMTLEPDMAAADALRRHLRSATTGPQQTSMRAFVRPGGAAAPLAKRARLGTADVDAIRTRLTLRALHALQQRAADGTGVTVCCVTQLELRSDKCMYYGCATCGRKVDAGTLRCPGIGCADPTGQPTMRLSCSFADTTGALERVTVFGNTAEALVERTAAALQQCTEDELGALHESQMWRRVELVWSVSGGALDVLRIRAPDWAQDVAHLQSAIDCE